MDARRKRLLFRCRHRGLQENDILLGRFAERHLAAMNEADLASLEALLEAPDNDLLDWLIGRVPPPPEFRSPLLARLIDEARTGTIAGRA